jgi:hypothetical protein
VRLIRGNALSATCRGDRGFRGAVRPVRENAFWRLTALALGGEPPAGADKVPQPIFQVQKIHQLDYLKLSGRYRTV